MIDISHGSVTVRAANPDDADQIARVYLESAEHHALLDPERYAVPSADTVVARCKALLEPRGEPRSIAVTLVAELAGELVGFVEARLDRSPDLMHREIRYCHIVEVAVRSTHRSQGIGARLLDAAEQWGREQGATFVSLEYLAVNVRAGEFYQRLGFHAAAITAIKRLS